MEKHYIVSILKRSIKEGFMVNVYSDQYHTDNSSVGFIDSLSAKQFVMKHVTPEGINDGYIIRRIDDIFRVDFDGEYEQRLELLYTLQKQQHENFLTKDVSKESDLFKESFIISKEKKLVVSVCIDETENQNDIIGFVKEVNSREVTINKISINGLIDGECTFFIEDIVKMNADTTDEKLIKLLFQYRNHSMTP